MTPAEFYVKYWKIEDENGNKHTPTLTEYEKLCWDAAYKLNVPLFVRNHSRRRGGHKVNPIVIEHLSKP